MVAVETVGVRDFANRASAVLDELEHGGRPIIVTRRGHPVAVLAPIDAEACYDYVLAHAPEFVAGRKAAEERFTRGDFGRGLEEVLAEPGRGRSRRGEWLRFAVREQRRRTSNTWVPARSAPAS